MLTFTTNIAYNRNPRVNPQRKHISEKSLEDVCRGSVCLYIYILICWECKQTNTEITPSLLCSVFEALGDEMHVYIQDTSPEHRDLHTEIPPNLTPFKNEQNKKNYPSSRIPTQTWHKHKPDMNSAFDFKETLDFPFQNTTQAKKLWGRFSDPYQIKIYRISTRLNTTPRTSAHVEAVRCLAFGWLERCLRSKTFGLGKSMQNLDLVAAYDRCLCPKDMMLKAQSPVIR